MNKTSRARPLPAQGLDSLLSIALLIKVIFTLIVGLLFTLGLFFGAPVESRP